MWHLNTINKNKTARERENKICNSRLGTIKKNSPLVHPSLRHRLQSCDIWVMDYFIIIFSFIWGKGVGSNHNHNRAYTHTEDLSSERLMTVCAFFYCFQWSLKCGSVGWLVGRSTDGGPVQQAASLINAVVICSCWHCFKGLKSTLITLWYVFTHSSWSSNDDDDCDGFSGTE